MGIEPCSPSLAMPGLPAGPALLAGTAAQPGEPASVLAGDKGRTEWEGDGQFLRLDLTFGGGWRNDQARNTSEVKRNSLFGRECFSFHPAPRRNWFAELSYKY